MRRLFASKVAALLALSGCAGVPSPLAPSLGGAVGLPHAGVLTEARELSASGEGYARLRDTEARFGHPRLVGLLERVAAEVERRRPGPPLLVGDLSARAGGRIPGHRSHRTGRDADLLLYALTPDGRPVRAPGFVRYGPDGLAVTPEGKFVRLDVERTWLLVRALVRDPEGSVQWVFVARWLEALLVEHALARGEDLDLVWKAENVLLQPGDSAPHADHLHVRIACTPEEAVAGCAGGPSWPWLPPPPSLPEPSDAEIARALGLGG